MTDKLLLIVWMKEGTSEKVRLYRGFIQENYIVHHIKAVCKGIKKNAITASTAKRLMTNGKIKLNKGVYTAYLYNESQHPEIIQDYQEYLITKLPTFVECISEMRERYCPDLKKVKEEFKGKIDDAYATEYLARELEEVQVAETEVTMWDRLVGQGWSTIDVAESKIIGSIKIHSIVVEYIGELRDDILMQASYGASSSTSQVSNVFENLKHKTIAKWYRGHAKEIVNLKEGVNYK